MEDFPEAAFSTGDLVFAKVKGYPPWPARIEDSLLGNAPVPYGKFNVFFFGTHEIGIIGKKNLYPYDEYKELYGKPSNKRGFKEALLEIVKNPAVPHKQEQRRTRRSMELKENKPKPKKGKLVIAVQKIDTIFSPLKTQVPAVTMKTTSSPEQKKEEQAKRLAGCKPVKVALTDIGKKSPSLLESNAKEVKPVKARQRRQLKVSTATNSNTHVLSEGLQQSDYDKLRDANLKNNKQILSKLLSDITQLQNKMSKTMPLKRKRESSADENNNSPARKQARRRSSIKFNPFLVRDAPMTRSRNSTGTPRVNYSELDSDDKDKIKDAQYFEESLIDDENYDPIPRRRSIHTRQVDVRPVEDITQDDVNNVATDCHKIYNQAVGTSCHQCRQKTIDMKTICRSGECIGVRGQFCGPCLKNRYGEDAKEALLDKDWQCPPCRGICNCSICRTRLGKRSTGILIHIAREHGYNDVNSYLQSLKRQLEQEKKDEDSDKQDSDTNEVDKNYVTNRKEADRDDERNSIDDEDDSEAETVQEGAPDCGNMYNDQDDIVDANEDSAQYGLADANEQD